VAGSVRRFASWQFRWQVPTTFKPNLPTWNLMGIRVLPAISSGASQVLPQFPAVQPELAMVSFQFSFGLPDLFSVAPDFGRVCTIPDVSVELPFFSPEFSTVLTNLPLIVSYFPGFLPDFQSFFLRIPVSRSLGEYRSGSCDKKAAR